MNFGKISIKGKDIRSIVGFLIESLDKEYPYHVCQSENVVVLIKEQGWLPSMEMANFMSVFFLKFSESDQVDIEVVTGGSERHYLFSWSIEKNENRRFIRTLKKICQDNDWVVTNVVPEKLTKPFLLGRIFKRK
ncbi:MAG TPA: hypothetical protein DHD79_03515 [Firmicutes bacterium]|mgnify:CR=1 FL=1|jgi:hypothetical protein|nr:hypothetical protein [Bacillota bacterium]HBE06794.1 hypothetical protein [Bacillota bacterium]HBL49448.1 hypothetical protein [Bacillota bacterium]HCX70291.1 hypothetical protein [Bacillota bacterium]